MSSELTSASVDYAEHSKRIIENHPPIAALYVDELGPYVTMFGVDAWTIKRDARNFEGKEPVVAHPPCGPWSRLKHLSRRHLDKPLAPMAVEIVRRNGGVLEHPKDSTLFATLALPKPGDKPDAYGGYTIQVDQVEWGHVARKSTWLYLVGIPRRELRFPPFPNREPTHWCSGGRNGWKCSSRVPTNMMIASAEQRRMTPPLLANELVRLARKVYQTRCSHVEK
jgi:hypothetical protein